MDWDEFAEQGRRIADWSAEYRRTLRERPVRARTAPGDIAAQLAESPPEEGEAFDAILADFERIVMPGMTHWQHPRFFAYFPSNAAPPSVLAEWIVSTMSAQCMLWQTSPAATEMETRMMDWLRQAIGLTDDYHGVIQDSASSATLASVLVMRERALDWAGNEAGLAGQKRLRIYCSEQVHTSVDRAVWVAGIGRENLVKIGRCASGNLHAMDTRELTLRIAADRKAGYLPAGIVASFGGTSVGGTDQLLKVAEIARAEGLFSHLDAAWAGTAMICPELRGNWAGAEQFDSVVFNPHKWLGANFDCSAHFLKDPEALTRTLAYRPEYLKTQGAEDIINYSEWSVPLGRRFRALKLWFLIRSYGLEGLRTVIRNHVAWSGELCERLRATPGIEIVTEPILSLFTFRVGGGDAANLALVQRINDDGRIYLTQTSHNGQIAIRFQCGAFEMTHDDIDTAYQVITELAELGP